MAESSNITAPEVRWSDGALKRMERAPMFLRGMVRRLAEKKARELGYAEITEEILFEEFIMGRDDILNSRTILGFEQR